MRLIPSRPAPGLSRRSFLKLTVTLGAAAGPLAWLPRRPALASTLPLQIPHTYFADPQALLARPLAGFDLLLVPAYAAAELIRRGALRPLSGTPGRAHDPDGAFSLAHAQRVGALIFADAAPGALEDLWRAGAVWPDSARLAIGAALLRRGYSPNDAHPGRLAQVEADLVRLGPRILADPIAAVHTGQAALALAWIGLPDLVPLRPGLQPASAAALRNGLQAWAPAQGAVLVEYDWVLPLGGSDPAGALALINENFPLPETRPDSLSGPAPLIPLTPLARRARGEYARIWARVKDAA